MNTAIVVALITSGIAAIASVLNIIFGYRNSKKIAEHTIMLHERSQTRERIVKAIETVNIKLKEYQESVNKMLRTSPPTDDPLNSALFNASLDKRREFEYQLSLEKLYLPSDIAKEAHDVWIAISRVAVFYSTTKELRGAEDGKERERDLTNAIEDMKTKMRSLELNFQKLLL
jgi:hypothetical protein